MAQRVIMLLTAAALLVVLTAATVSPAFAGRGYQCGQETDQKGKQEPCPEYTANNGELWGYGCGQNKFKTAYSC